MSEKSSFEMYQKKLQGLCDEHNLVAKIQYDRYPIQLVIMPCTGVDGQLSMMEGISDSGAGYISQDAAIIFYMEDGELNERIKGTFDIADTLKTKLKTLYKKLHFLYLQFFHRELITKYGLAHIPRITESGAKTGSDAASTVAQQMSLDENQSVSGIPVLDSEDDQVKAAISIVRATNKASTDLLCREMQITKSHAVQIMVTLEHLGVVGPYNGSDDRQVLPWDEPED